MEEFTHILDDTLEVSAWYNRQTEEIVIYNSDSKDITSSLTWEQKSEVEDAYFAYQAAVESGLSVDERREMQHARHNHRDSCGYLTREY